LRVVETGEEAVLEAEILGHDEGGVGVVET
jgi:hypothetical protein